MNNHTRVERASDADSSYAWLRLAIAVLVSTIGGVGMWSVVVALPAIQADFGVARADASLPYTLTMLGFGAGGIVTGRLADRYGIAMPLAIGAISLALGYVATGYASSLWQVAIAHGLLIGLGCSTTFGPMMADMSHWFVRRRGIAVAIVASGNYLAGTFWPPVVQHFIANDGWRATHIGIGLFLLVTMLPLTYFLRGRMHHSEASSQTAARRQAELPFSGRTLQVLLCIAGVACCVAMSMPQVHIVAYCGDLGYGVARGAEMLSLMMAFGIVSRVASGFVADRIGGVRTLLLGSVLQGVALFFYLFFDGLASLYVISAMFGLFQGGIVPSYAIIVREYFSPKEAGTRVGLVLMATLIGMAGGGWMSGAIFDFTGSYKAAFLNGLGWNLVNVSIMTWLLLRSRGRHAPAHA
ncbi:MAG TPA: MFS transporter [Pseudolabrys sp.]|nr:MFS transporter [Pseudolabrys sp.]